MLRGRKISLKTFLKSSPLWICHFFTAGVFPCPSKSYFSRMGRRATMILSRSEGFDLIVESMFPSLNYTSNSCLSPEEFVRCIWSDMPNTQTIGAPSGHCSCWSHQNHHSSDKIQLMYLFIPPPVAWFHLWVDMFLNRIDIHCWSIRHMFPVCRLVPEELKWVSQVYSKRNVCNQRREGCLDWRNDCHPLCLISKSQCPSRKTFRSTSRMMCWKKWRCGRLPL